MFVHTSNSLECRPGSTVPNTHTVESLFLCSPLHYPTHPFCKFLIRNPWHRGLRPNHVHNSVRRPEHVPAAISPSADLAVSRSVGSWESSEHVIERPILLHNEHHMTNWRLLTDRVIHESDAYPQNSLHGGPN